MKLCTKCRKEPRADQQEDATNRHCKNCRTESARAYTMAKLEQTEGKGFGKGVQKMRELLAAEFEAQGPGHFSGIEIAQIIRGAAGPLPERDAEPTKSDE